jgi:hypothetical protein
MRRKLLAKMIVTLVFAIPLLTGCEILAPEMMYSQAPDMPYEEGAHRGLSEEERYPGLVSDIVTDRMLPSEVQQASSKRGRRGSCP